MAVKNVLEGGKRLDTLAFTTVASFARTGPQDSMALWGTETITLRTGTAPTDVLLVETAP